MRDSGGRECGLNDLSGEEFYLKFIMQQPQAALNKGSEPLAGVSRIKDRITPQRLNSFVEASGHCWICT